MLLGVFVPPETSGSLAESVLPEATFLSGAIDPRPRHAQSCAAEDGVQSVYVDSASLHHS